MTEEFYSIGTPELEEALREQIKVLVEALRAVEWVPLRYNAQGDAIVARCPWCWQYEHEGHKDNCGRQAAFAAVEPPDA